MSGATGPRAAEPVYMFLDTNLLLEFKLFREVDWRVMFDGRSVVLVMAPVVLGEIDRFKHAGTKRQKERARTVSKAFDELELSHQPARVREGVEVVAISNEPSRTIFENHSLQPDVPDDRLLAVLIEFRERLVSGEVFLVTDDTNLRVKARPRGIPVRKPDESLRLPDEPDEMERKLAAANRELAIYKNARPDLRATLGGKSHSLFTVELVNPLPGKQINKLLAAWRKRYPRVEAMPEMPDGPMGLSVSLKQFGKAYGFGYVSKEEAAERNMALDGLLSNYEEYLRLWHGLVNQRRCTLKLPFTLENTGTEPADDVHVEFLADARGEWLERPHKRPKPPAPLRARHPFDLSYRTLMPNLDLAGIQSDAHLDGPEIVASSTPRVRYWARRVKHHVACNLPEVCFLFATAQDVGSFTIHYRINAGNVHEPVSGEMGIKVETRDGAEVPLPPAPEPIDDDADNDDEDGEL